jgi:hypothetical protein
VINPRQEGQLILARSAGQAWTCERALRPTVVQRKVTNGYRAMGAAEGEAIAVLMPTTSPLRLKVGPPEL